MLFQANPDAGIHLTLGAGISTIIAKIIFDEVRGRRNGNGNGNEKLLQEIRDGIRELLTIVKIKNNL